MHRHFFALFANISAVILLVTLIAAPIYFARNFSKVAGVKSQSQYLIVSQVEKFPGMTYEQVGDTYKITPLKQNESQAYLGIVIINNPTNGSQTYSLETKSPDSEVFFGLDLENRLIKITLPSASAIPISIRSGKSNQTVEFKVLNY